MRFTVRTAELRLALRAVALHAEPDPEVVQRHRVRLDRGPDTVTVSATNGYTVGHALSRVVDQGDAELGPFDVSPNDVVEILALFTGKADKHEIPGHALELDVTREHLAVTDVSGLFDGKALTLPRHPLDDNYPQLADLIAAKIEKRAQPADRLIVNNKLLALFVKSAAIYDAQLVIDPAGNTAPALVTCGDSFVGLLYPAHPDDESTARINGWQMDWLLRTADQVPGAQAGAR